MSPESATTTYYMPEHVEEAVRLVRRVLVEAGLKITGELDMAGRLRRRLQVDTPACKVLFVAAGAAGKERGVTAMPLHVVVSERGEHSEIHIMRVPATVDAQAAAPELGQFRVRIAQAIERIAMRVLLGI